MKQTMLLSFSIVILVMDEFMPISYLILSPWMQPYHTGHMTSTHSECVSVPSLLKKWKYPTVCLYKSQSISNIYTHLYL